MRKLIILLLCCGVLVSMAGCGGNTAPPINSPPTTVSEAVITEIPSVTTVEPTEEEKELPPTESEYQAAEPTVTATEPTTTVTEKPNEEIKPTAPAKPTESSAAEITEPKIEEPSKAKETCVGIE